MALGEKHYKNLLGLIENALNINAQTIFRDLYDDIINIGPKYILQRDLEAMINWSLCSVDLNDLLETQQYPFYLSSDKGGSIESIFKAYYPQIEVKAREEKIKKISSFLIEEAKNKKEDFKDLISKKWPWPINTETLQAIQLIAHGIQEPNEESIKRYSKVSIALKWLQHPSLRNPSLKNKLSDGLQKHIFWLGDTFGKYKEKEIIKLNEFIKEPYPLSEQDLQVLEKSKLLDAALIYCRSQIKESTEKLEKYGEAWTKFINTDNYEKEKEKIMKNKELNLNQKKKGLIKIKEIRKKIIDYNQFYLLSNSVETLEKYITGKIDIQEIELFKDELLVATFLIYMQDPFASTVMDPVSALKSYKTTSEEKDKKKFKRLVMEPISLARAAWIIRDKYIKYKKKSGTDAKS